MSELWQGFIEFLSDRFAWLAWQLHPLRWMALGMEMIAGFLPAPLNFVYTMSAHVLLALDFLMPYIVFADYFINLQMLVLTVGFMFAIESAISLFRLWRMIRSLVT